MPPRPMPHETPNLEPDFVSLAQLNGYDRSILKGVPEPILRNALHVSALHFDCEEVRDGVLANPDVADAQPLLMVAEAMVMLRDANLTAFETALDVAATLYTQQQRQETDAAEVTVADNLPSRMKALGNKALSRIFNSRLAA